MSITELEENMFDTICGLHECLVLRKKESYKLFLITLDELNENYKQQTEKYYIDPVRCADYYSKLWEF